MTAPFSLVLCLFLFSIGKVDGFVVVLNSGRGGWTTTRTRRRTTKGAAATSSTLSMSSSLSSVDSFSKKKVVLVVGSCGLDRLLTVSSYPTADSKIRTTDYNEVGGGNAANTATAMALLSSSSNDNDDLSVQLLTKVGDDVVGQLIQDELIQAGVDLSSPLFRIGHEGSTTAFTTVVVSSEDATRTCIHTPGTCGELTLEDVASVDLDHVFANVVHLHSDCRHTNVALALAQEARRRGIPVSVDAEKDRNIASQDGLLQCANLVFTNSQQLNAYLLKKQTQERQTTTNSSSMPPQPTIIQNWTGAEVKDDDNNVRSVIANSIHPSWCFLQWYGPSQRDKQVIITKGSMGALHVACYTPKEIDVDDDNGTFVVKTGEDSFVVTTAGVLSGLDIVDTTGAGDAFIGGYLWSRLTHGCQSDLKFGAWVGGRKLQGPGARSTLPTKKDVETCLGKTPQQIQESLERLVGPFGAL